MADEQQYRVAYIGPAPLASLVAQMLTNAGLDVSWDPPHERRDMQTTADTVIVYYFCKGTDAAVKAAVQAVRERLRVRGRIDLNGGDEPALALRHAIEYTEREAPSGRGI
jgi:hypothetical protein